MIRSVTTVTTGTLFFAFRAHLMAAAVVNGWKDTMAAGSIGWMASRTGRSVRRSSVCCSNAAARGESEAR